MEELPPEKAKRAQAGMALVIRLRASVSTRRRKDVWCTTGC
jgi:hypothetical protein